MPQATDISERLPPQAMPALSEIAHGMEVLMPSSNSPTILMRYKLILAEAAMRRAAHQRMLAF
jgi:L-fucose mutarotase/ribose pyranase (RbsD/FucU family)